MTDLFLLGQIDALKDTAYYVPFAMIAIAFGAFIAGYKWMRATTKSEIAESVKALQDQIDSLKQKVTRLENGRAKATRLIYNAIEALPINEDNAKGRQCLHEAIDALLSGGQGD
jgi:anthranilate phosphoribosyltransferase